MLDKERVGIEVKEFVCECGRKFNNGQSFNGHKSHCKIHMLKKYGNLDKIKEQDEIRGKSISQYYAKTKEDRENQKQEQ